MSWVAVGIGGGALVGAIGSNMAANTQAGSANNAAALQYAMFNQTQQNLQPYMTAGTGALSELVAGTTGNYVAPTQQGGQAGYDAALAAYNAQGPLPQGYNPYFSAPRLSAPVLADYLGSGQQSTGALMPQSYTPYDMNTFQNSPEYQLMMQQNAGALNASQNASSLTGGANSNNLKSLINWTQGNTVSQYGAGLNDYIQQFLTGNQAINQQFNTLNTLAGSGQNAAANLGGMSTNVGANIGANIVGAGNANAAGTVGVANSLTNAGNQGYQAYLQQQYLNMYNNPNYATGSGGVYSGNVNIPATQVQ